MEGEFGGGAPREDILARLKAWRNDLQAKPSYSRLAELRKDREGEDSGGRGQSGENKCAGHPLHRGHP